MRQVASMLLETFSMVAVRPHTRLPAHGRSVARAVAAMGCIPVLLRK